MSSTGNLLRKRRKHLKITQTALAKDLGFTNVFLQRVESGRCGLPGEHATKIAYILNIDPKKLRAAMWKDLKAKFHARTK